ncbi:protein translocase subunit SecD [Candidatus Marinamargulisbacteria bacterium SCGC AG-439-L15]|nr:protein translocase subunit SecD [Candidatus Marinamargulisbacteria bacterium SCGC AG-439-L15]
MSTKWRVLILLTVLGVLGYFLMTKPIRLGLDLQGGTHLIIEAKDTDGVLIDQNTMAGILSVIRQRVDGLGVSEPVIQRKGLRQVVVELPGVKDPERAIKLIGETALLEFVEAEWPPSNILDLPEEKREILVGKDTEISTIKSYDAKGILQSERPIILRNRVLTGADLTLATPGTDSYGRPIVQIEFTTEAAKTFYNLTQRWIGKPVAIVLDGQIISAPNINSPIPGGKAVIEGNFSVQEMRELVIKLKAGSLPVPVEIISNKIVGPTLGKDSIEKSKKAGVIGFAIVCLYMIAFYRISGVIASIALVLYLGMDIALLKALDATLTLPGIAGIILTLGMAVDANVIIFERIRDEFKVGNPLQTAIAIGFRKGVIAIVDSNVTTMVAAIVLFWLGTGTIKGFALTLSVGILLSMFSAIFVTKLFIDYVSSFKHVSEKLFIRGHS